MRHHPQQPFVVDRIEKAAKVGIEHPVHALAHQRRMQRRKSHMRVPSWPEAVGEAEEIDLVDGAEKLGDCTLNDLVLQSRHAERALPAIGFRDVDTPNRLWPVTARVDAGAEIPEVGLQVLLVRRHRHPIDPRTCQPLLSPERPFERRDVDMMQQASEPGLGGLLGRRVHPREVGRQGCPALCPDPGLHARDPPGLVPSLSASRLLRRLHRYYEPVRLPTSARMMASAVPCHHPPPETNPADPVGPLRFQRWPSMHDVAHDPGGATPSRLAMAHMLPSLDATSSASAILNLSRLNTDALHGSCLRFGPRVAATPARLGSGLPATALAG